MAIQRKQWGISPWNHDAPVWNVSENDARPDVVIVGAGLTGASTAYHLAKLGVRALILEAGLVSDGASGRTGGIVLEGTATGPREKVEACVPGLKHLIDVEGIDCDLDLPGCWEIEHPKRTADRMLPWEDAGKHVSIARTVAGGVVEPARLNLGIAQAAIRAGATLRQNAPVVRIQHESELAVYLDNECIRPGWIVVALNAWMQSIVPETNRVRSSLTFACATEPLTESALREIGLDGGVPFYTADLPYLWGRITRDRRVIFGAGLLFGTPRELEQTGLDDPVFAGTLEGLQERIRGLHPALNAIGFSASWAGPIAFRDNAIPVLGNVPSCPRILVSGAYAGHGVALSVRAAELLAAAIVHGEPLPSWGSLEH